MSKKKWIVTVSAVLTVGILSYIFFRYQYIPRSRYSEEVYADSLSIEKEALILYGIPADSFDIVEGVIKNNQTIGNLLGQYNLPEGALGKLLSISRDIFDLRKVRAGNKYMLFFDKDTSRILRYFVYEHDYVEYNKLCFFDTVWAEKGQKDVKVVRRLITGKIVTSLWNATIDAGANPMLANDLSDIYAWSIDFFGLQPNDSFSVVCDEQFVDTLSLGFGKIYAAYFRHANNDFYAIPFTQAGVESYYDMDGNSLRKAFLKAPLQFRRISSRFSNNRMHPVLKIRRPHHGVDYSAPYGTAVFAIGDGRITKANYGYNNGAGNNIRIRHNGVYETVYMHLQGFAKGIHSGIYVKQGDLIGFVGSTGLSTGPHLDFRFYKNGSAIDPLRVEAPPVEPIHDTNRVAFDTVKAFTLKLLGGIK